MKKYELLSIIKPNLDMDEVEKVVANLEEAIKKEGGTVSSVDKLGRKKLAYEIQKFRDGFYVVIELELPSEKVVTLKRYLKLNESTLRNIISVLEPAAVAAK